MSSQQLSSLILQALKSKIILYSIHATRQIVVIAEAAGDVTINHCEFVNNHLYNTAIYYLSNKGNHSDDIHELLINNCNFTCNLGGTSIIVCWHIIGHLFIEEFCILQKSRKSNVYFKHNFGYQWHCDIWREPGRRCIYGGEIFADKNSSINFHTNSIVNVSW